MNDYINSYYSQTRTDTESFPTLDELIEADVVIIGGGLAGLSTCLELARAGKKPVLIEQNRIAWGASGRNGGLVIPGFAEEAEHIISRVGLTHAKELLALSQQGAELVRSNIHELKIEDASIEESGALLPSRYNNEIELKKYREWSIETLGWNADYLNTESLRETLLSTRYFQALFFSDAFHFHPLNYALALSRECRRLGAKVFEQTPAIDLKQNSNGVLLHTPQGQIIAEHVVICCGGYTDNLVPKIKRAYLPIATYVLVTQPDSKINQHIRTKAMIMDERRAGDYYRIVDSNRLLWGGKISTRTARPDDIEAQLRHSIENVYPQLESLTTDQSWSGLMSYARHKMPQIGKLPQNIWYATAFGGHGMNTTAMAGQLIASAISDGDERYQLFEPYGLKWNGGVAGRISVQGIYWYLQFKNWIQESRGQT